MSVLPSVLVVRYCCCCLQLRLVCRVLQVQVVDQSEQVVFIVFHQWSKGSVYVVQPSAREVAQPLSAIPYAVVESYWLQRVH